MYRIPAIFLIMLVFAVSVPNPVQGAEVSLSETLAGLDPGDIIPGADSFNPLQGSTGISQVNEGDQQLGYVFLNTDFVKSIGYSGKPIHLLIGMSNEGTITGVKLIKHHEPIVLIGIPEHKIVSVLENYVGTDIVEYARDRKAKPRIDIVSGATVTIMVMDDSILNSAVKVAHQLGIGGLEKKESAKLEADTSIIDTSFDQVEDWFTLVKDESVTRLSVVVGKVNETFEAAGDAKAIARPEQGSADEQYFELLTALISPPGIGRSLIGEGEYRNLTKRLSDNQHAILLMGNGRYSFKGSGYVRGGIFDRFQLVQGDQSVRFKDVDHKRIRRVAADGAPEFSEVGIFTIPQDFEFAPTRSWRIELLVSRDTGPTTKAFTTFELKYQVPTKYVKTDSVLIADKPQVVEEADANAAGELPLWTKLWLQKTVLVGALLAALAVLTFVFFAQDWLVNRPKLINRIRLGFLCFTFVGLGLYANAQLSVVNILTVFNALASGFDWEYFLMEPLIFILWGSVAASLLFWGRGVFCGWLCPFGALQELLNRLAKRLKIPQVRVPWWLHERLWALKYIIFLGLFGVSLHSLEWAERLAEIEPFKTVIILKLDRSWPFVVFALAMLAAGLVIERFYCRYLCPLGAALAIPGKIRMFEWLKRYKECGTPCQRCSKECMVQAIHPAGNINPNECLYCLHCQIVYYDQEACPVLIQRRLKRERRGTAAKRNQVSLTELVDQLGASKNGV